MTNNSNDIFQLKETGFFDVWGNRPIYLYTACTLITFILLATELHKYFRSLVFVGGKITEHTWNHTVNTIIDDFIQRLKTFF